MQLEDKTAVLTGASSGLGWAMAGALVGKGAEVYGLARNKDKLNELETELGDAFYPVQLDIGDSNAVTQWVEDTFSESLCPDILINNAGIGSYGKIDEIPESEWVNMVNTNLNGLYFLTSKIAALMKTNSESSHILNIGSILGTMGKAEGTAYCATKFGVRGFSEALFKELRPYHIKVTCVNPGSIDTAFFRSSGVEAHKNMLQPKNLADTVVHVLETPDNMLINDMVIRPLDPRKSKD